MSTANSGGCEGCLFRQDARTDSSKLPPSIEAFVESLNGVELGSETPEDVGKMATAFGKRLCRDEGCTLTMLNLLRASTTMDNMTPHDFLVPKVGATCLLHEPQPVIDEALSSDAAIGTIDLRALQQVLATIEALGA